MALKFDLDFLDLNAQKQTHFTNYKRIICQMNDSHYQPDDYSLGMNCGQAAGQSIFHFHCHIIPCYNGDTRNPRDGIRHCIPGMGYYWFPDTFCLNSKDSSKKP